MMRQPEPTPLAARRPTPAPSTSITARPRCLVIVPVFNERGSVTKVVRRLRQALPEYDVLVIDDGSTDDTLRRIPSGVTVVSLPFNLGIGGGPPNGFKKAPPHRHAT